MKCVLCFLLLVSVIGINTDTNTSKCRASSVGTNFVFGIIGWGARLPSYRFYLHITTVMQEPAHVRVTSPSIDFNRTYTVSNFTTVPLNATLIQYENGTQFKGTEVSSDVNVSVTVFTGSTDLAEGYLVLPVTALGTRYIAASYDTQGVYTNEILVAGLQNETDVTLKEVIDSNVSFNKTFRLQKFETYQLRSKHNTSGSFIISNKPVAVISGASAAQIPLGIGGPQYLIEQMIPTKYWTTKFIITPIYPRKYFALRIFANHDSTELYHYNSTNHFSIRMNKGSMKELLFGTYPVVIVANKPIYVMQYGYDGDNMAGDPFMSNVQGISQFSDKYNFVTQNYHSEGSNTIAITILKNSTDGLLLNGHSVSYWNAKKVPVSPPLDQYVTLFVNVSYNSYYQLRHSGGIKFGAVLYGRHGTAVAYGYPLGLSFIDMECETQEASFKTTPAYDKASTVSTHPDQKGEDTWCFQCDGLTHLQYCDQVQKCQTQDEVCYVQKYHRSLGGNLFRSGCIRSEQCNNHYVNNGCMECCYGNFCNTAGCGEIGIPALGKRGPICFECTHIGEDEDCNTVQLCHSNQACMVAKYEWGDNNFFYDMECRDIQVCSAQESPTELTKRHVPVCTHCCHSDFCNMNCTSGDSIPAIIG